MSHHGTSPWHLRLLGQGPHSHTVFCRFGCFEPTDVVCYHHDVVKRGRNFQFRLILLALVVSFIVASSAAVSQSQGSYKSDPAYVRARQVFTRARSLPNFSQLQSNDNRFNALYANLANVLSAIDSGRSDMVKRGGLTEFATDNLNAYSDALLREYLEPGKPVTSAPSSAAPANVSSSGPARWVGPVPQPTPQIDLTSYGGPPP